MDSLLGPELTAIPGQYLTFGTDGVLEQIPDTPHVALLGPVLNYEETRQLIEGLTERYPEVGLSWCASSAPIWRTGSMACGCTPSSHPMPATRLRLAFSIA